MILSTAPSGNESTDASTFIVTLLYVLCHFIFFLFKVSRASFSSSLICSDGNTAFNIADPNFIEFCTEGDIVHASTFKSSIFSIASSVVHVIISHVITSCTGVSSDELHHDDFFFHCATNSAHHNGIVSGKSGSHLTNLYHALVGLVGAVRFDSYFHVSGFTSLPLFASNVIVYIFLLYCTLTIVLPSHLIGSCTTDPLSTNPL
jgi:hypothetical protein